MITSTATLKIIDSVAIVIAQAYQLARCRLASTASPAMQMMMECDELHTEVVWLKRELEILRSQRAVLAPKKRPAYSPEQRFDYPAIDVATWLECSHRRQAIGSSPSIDTQVGRTMENGDPTGSMLSHAR
ncbi:MAG TPA: hypothetical protein DCM28_07825 [Phycisphaerales bacterium]|nr:hypothetical protein [Phycisphaerales bacterium]